MAFKQDCASVVIQAQKGPSCYLGSQSAYARSWHILHTALDSDAPISISWIPAHTAEEDIPTRISKRDRYGNDLADFWAKKASRGQLPSRSARLKIKQHSQLVAAVSTWIGHAGVIANAKGMRDSTACPAESGRRRARNALRPKLTKAPKPLILDARPLALGGHALVECPTGWKCTTCRVASAEWNRIAPKCCSGSAAAKWAVRAAEDDGRGIHHDGSHVR